ncbi:hypothetical protein E3N88_33582 [Mikania micrantha]|uniref:Uncharacterized protein n=1 Tax=Mikania micrantha TaxID=192012 RepID=A0A5N6MD12_9ASTR|nr:hypothetical protein E3N88_33582 [Mikania micrantha]
MFPSLFTMDKEKACMVADRVSNAEGTIRISWCWAKEPVRQEDLEAIDASIISLAVNNLTNKYFHMILHQIDAVNNHSSHSRAVDFEVQRLVGRTFNDPEVQKLRWHFKVIKGTYGLPKVVVEYKCKQKEFSAEEISSMHLVYVKKLAESHIGTAVKDVVITVPPYFNDSQRQATKVAAHLAGLDVLQIIDKPFAAAIAYGLHMKTTDTNVLVFDLDYVTFDVSIITTDEKGKLTVKATGGDTHFGGVDLVDIMFDHFVKEFNRIHQMEMDITRNSKARNQLRGGILSAIEDLVSNTETTISIESLYKEIGFSTRITRNKFEYMSKGFFSKCIEMLASFLRDAKINKTNVDVIVLVDWWTNLPKLQQLLREFFNVNELFKSIDAVQVVAHGAAIHAANLIREKSEKEKTLPTLSLPDIVPLSLGVDAHDGVFSVIIPRNAPIPAEKEQIYFTTFDNQTSIPFNAYQGERSRAKDNIWLGEFEVTVSPAPKGKSKITVAFSVDADGTLNCKVKELTTGLKKEFTINHNKEKLSHDVIKKMVKDAERYKMEDQEYIKIMHARNVLKEYIYNVRRKMKTIGITDKTRLHAEQIKKMETTIEDANQYIDGNQELADVDEYKKVQNQLEKLCWCHFTTCVINTCLW